MLALLVPAGVPANGVTDLWSFPVPLMPRRKRVRDDESNGNETDDAIHEAEWRLEKRLRMTDDLSPENNWRVAHAAHEPSANAAAWPYPHAHALAAVSVEHDSFRDQLAARRRAMEAMYYERLMREEQEEVNEPPLHVGESVVAGAVADAAAFSDGTHAMDGVDYTSHGQDDRPLLQDDIARYHPAPLYGGVMGHAPFAPAPEQHEHAVSNAAHVSPFGTTHPRENAAQVVDSGVFHHAGFAHGMVDQCLQPFAVPGASVYAGINAVLAEAHMAARLKHANRLR